MDFGCLGVFFVETEKFPVVLTDSSEFSMSGVVEKFCAGGGFGSGDGLSGVVAIAGMVFGEMCLGEGGEGGKEFEGAEHFLAGGVGGDGSRGPHDAGDALAAFEVGGFAVTEGFSGAAMVFEGEPRSVV